MSWKPLKPIYTAILSCPRWNQTIVRGMWIFESLITHSETHPPTADLELQQPKIIIIENMCGGAGPLLHHHTVALQDSPQLCHFACQINQQVTGISFSSSNTTVLHLYFTYGRSMLCKCEGIQNCWTHYTGKYTVGCIKKAKLVRS